MLKNYLKIAWRNVMKNKLFSFINIIGLSAGLTCCILITLFILNETGYDKYQKNAANIYQVGTEFIGLGNFKKLPNTPAAMGEMLHQQFPEIKQTTRLVKLFAENKTLIQYQQSTSNIKAFYETKGYLADSTFFRMFTYNFTEGNAQTALNNPNSIVLNEAIAQKLFGNQPAINKTIHISSSSNGDHDYLVTGVFKPINKPSHVDARFFLSMAGGNIEDMIKNAGANLANNNLFYTYLMLAPDADPKKLQSKFAAFIKQFAGKDLKANGFYRKQYLVGLRDVHLHSGAPDNVTPSGSTTYLYILASIAIFTLLIACINFMNLATAHSAKRSAEVGIRKVLGAQKKLLVTQFLGESVLMSMAAFLFAIIFTKLLLPAFNTVSGKQLSLSFDNTLLVASFFLLSVITGLIAGSYPAFYLSSFNPAKVLKGKFSNSLAAVSLRKGLVVFQFFVSVLLIIASVVILKQMNYMRSADLGFDKDRQVVIALRSNSDKKNYITFRDELLKQSFIENVGASAFYPGITNFADNVIASEGQSMQEGKDVRMNYVDMHFLQTLNIKPVAGRIFSEAFHADTSGTIILNENAVKTFGLTSPQAAINKKLHSEFQGVTYYYTVIGVVKDFHYEDLHVPVTPFGFQLNTQPTYNYMVVHFKPGNLDAALKSLQITWQKINTNEPFEYTFLDEDFQKNYDGENHLASIVGYFTIIAILISCLGLFGLATFSAEQRIKEIGVRKVLGASVSSIVTLLSKDFIKLVAIAVLIASPLAWFVMNKWLQGFAYRINISWIVFVLTAVTAITIALATISFQAIRAAIANPVKSLRTE